MKKTLPAEYEVTIIPETVETMRARKIPLPTPKRKFSGQFNVRVSRSLHRTLVHTAAEEGVSLNALVSQLLQTTLVHSAK